jgi:hypothetical protein
VRLSHPAICSGDHFCLSFAATIAAAAGVAASLHTFGRLRRCTAARSAAHGPVAATASVGLATSREIVEGQRPSHGQLVRTHPIRHDRAKEHGAFAHPAGKPDRSNAAPPAPWPTRCSTGTGATMWNTGTGT